MTHKIGREAALAHEVEDLRLQVATQGEVLRLLEVYCDQHAGAALALAKDEAKGTYNRALRLGLANGYIGVKKLLRQPDRLHILRVETRPDPTRPA